MLKYSDRPVLHYGSKPLYDGGNLHTELMRDTQPMASAPQNAARPIVLIEPTGKQHFGMYYRGSWRIMEQARDEYSGRTNWRMTDTTVANPIRWREAK